MSYFEAFMDGMFLNLENPLAWAGAIFGVVIFETGTPLFFLFGATATITRTSSAKNTDVTPDGKIKSAPLSRHRGIIRADLSSIFGPGGAIQNCKH